VRLHSEYNLEALVWCLVLGVFLLRFMTLGTKINRKYRNLSVLITEQVCVCGMESDILESDVLDTSCTKMTEPEH
jgi:hypothetical protein